MPSGLPHGRPFNRSQALRDRLAEGFSFVGILSIAAVNETPEQTTLAVCEKRELT